MIRQFEVRRNLTGNFSYPSPWNRRVKNERGGKVLDFLVYVRFEKKKKFTLVKIAPLGFNELGSTLISQFFLHTLILFFFYTFENIVHERKGNK